MFDLFKDNDDIVAAIFTAAEMQKGSGVYARQSVVEIHNQYMELLKNKRAERYAAAKAAIGDLNDVSGMFKNCDRIDPMIGNSGVDSRY